MERSKKYDIPRLRRDLHQLSEEIRAQKKAIRRPHYNPTAQETLQLWRLKRKATALCCLRAHHRGKTHLPRHRVGATGIELNVLYVRELEAGYMIQQEVAA